MVLKEKRRRKNRTDSTFKTERYNLYLHLNDLNNKDTFIRNFINGPSDKQLDICDLLANNKIIREKLFQKTSSFIDFYVLCFMLKEMNIYFI